MQPGTIESVLLHKVLEFTLRAHPFLQDSDDFAVAVPQCHGFDIALALLPVFLD